MCGAVRRHEAPAQVVLHRIVPVRLEQRAVEIALDRRVARPGPLRIPENVPMAGRVEHKMREAPREVRMRGRLPLAAQRHEVLDARVKKDAAAHFVAGRPDLPDLIVRQRVIIKENVRSLDTDIVQILLLENVGAERVGQRLEDFFTESFMSIS